MAKPLSAIFEEIKNGTMTQDDLQEQITTMVLKRYGLPDDQKSNEGADDKKNQEAMDLLKQERDKAIGDLKQLQDSFKNNSQVTAELQKKIDTLEEANMTSQEKVKKEWEKQLANLQLSVEKEQVKTKSIYNRFKEQRLLSLATSVAKDLNLDKYESAGEYLLLKGFLDLKEVNDNDGNLEGYVPFTPEITYHDKDLQKDVKKSFEGEKGIKEAFKILAEQNPRIKEMFPIMENAPQGSGTNFQSSGNSGQSSNFDNMTEKQIMEKAHNYSMPQKN